VTTATRPRAASATLAVVGPAARENARPLAAAAALAVVQAGAELAVPWPLALAVDHAIDRAPMDGVLGLVLGRMSPAGLLAVAGISSVLLTVAVGLLEMVSTVVSERAAERIGATLRATTFRRSLDLSLRWHDRMRSGELVARLTSDVGRMLDAVVVGTVTLLPDLALVTGVLAVLVAFDAGLAGVGLAVIPVLAVLAARQRARVRTAATDARAESGRLTATVTDLLRNVRAVQAFGQANRAAAIFGVRNRAVCDVEVRAAITEARWAPTADLVLALGAGAALVVGGRQVLSGAVSTGDLLVVLAYLRSLYTPVRSLARFSGVLAKSGASAVRLREVIDSTDAVPEAPHPVPAPCLVDGVRFHHVGFRYDDGTPVLEDFDLCVAAGETVALVGPSGIGKSTVLHLLLRLYDVDEGQVTLDGLDIRSLRLASLRRRIAFVPQDPWLLDATVAENIAFGSPTATRAEVIDAARAALVDEFVDRLPQGYDTMLGEGGARLSGGQRRRVALARAAVSEAPMVLLDEPTASLDPRSAGAVVAAIRTATARRTVLLVTHDDDLAAIADRVVRIDRCTAAPVLGRGELLPAGRR
jgi:ABC-type multidrug transport system fused ATPase/permease subunit